MNRHAIHSELADRGHPLAFKAKPEEFFLRARRG